MENKKYLKRLKQQNLVIKISHESECLVWFYKYVDSLIIEVVVQ